MINPPLFKQSIITKDYQTSRKLIDSLYKEGLSTYNELSNWKKAYEGLIRLNVMTEKDKTDYNRLVRKIIGQQEKLKKVIEIGLEIMERQYAPEQNWRKN